MQRTQEAFMDANDYFKSGKEHLEKKDYEKAIAEFWKGLELTHEPDKIEELRQEAKDFEPQIVAEASMETLMLALGIKE